MTRFQLTALFGLTIVVAIGCGDGEDVAQTGGAGEATSTGTSTSSDGTTTGALSEESSESSTDTSGGFTPDLPPYPTACNEPEALIDVAASSTPVGPMTIDEAWLELDFCGGGPFVVLVQTPTLEMPEGITVTVAIIDGGPSPDPLLGEYQARVWGDQEALGTIELLTPFTYPNEVGVPRPDAHFHAMIDIQGGGYELSLEVDLIDCGVADCYCPCR